MNDNDLRQFLVAQALQGLCANPNLVRNRKMEAEDIEAVAHLAINMADALIEVQLIRKKRRGRVEEMLRQQRKAGATG